MPVSTGAAEAAEETATPAAPEPPEELTAAEERGIEPEASTDAFVAEAAPEAGEAEPVTAELPITPSIPDAEPAPAGEERPSADDVFARLRAGQSEGAARLEAGEADGGAEGAEESGGGEVEEPLDHDSALVLARDQSLAPLQQALARQLKRALADEQNEVFDRLRRRPKIAVPEEILGTDTEHAERYRAAGEDAVWAAALAGARSTAPAGTERDGGLEAALEHDRVLDEVLDEISLELALPVRERLEAALAAAEGDADEATTLLRSAYREWKSQRLDELAGDLARSAFGRGAYAAVAPGAPIRWVVDQRAPGCDDAPLDSAAGAVPRGQPFPSGHRHPPAQAGCRCLIEPAHD